MTARRDSWKFAFVLAVIGAHTLRNVSLAGYMGVYALAALWTFVAFLRSGLRERLMDRGALLLVWLAVFASGFLVTLAISGPAAAANGLSRLVFPLPIFFALVAWTHTRGQLIRHVGLMVGLFAVLSLTLPLQFLTGPIPFFAEPSTRGGEIRYASAVGSLTSIGIIVGCYLVLAQLLRPRWRWLLIAAITLPAVASLSKAAVANVMLGLLVVLWFNRRNRWVFGTAALGIPAAALLVYTTVPAIRDRVGTTLISFGFTTSKGSEVDDVSVGVSMVERLALLPAENWAGLARLGNQAVYLVGGGFGMADTALVSGPQGLAMMAHNQFFESLTVFGVLGGMVQWTVVVLLGVLLVRRHTATSDPLFSVAAATMLVFCANSFMANGTLYQPLAGAVLYLLFFIALSTRVDADRRPQLAATVAPTKEKPWSS